MTRFARFSAMALFLFPIITPQQQEKCPWKPFSLPEDYVGIHFFLQLSSFLAQPCGNKESYICLRTLPCKGPMLLDWSLQILYSLQKEITFSTPILLAIASTISKANQQRFSRDLPYWYVRSFTSSFRNLSISYPRAPSISIPSKPIYKQQLLFYKENKYNVQDHYIWH